MTGERECTVSRAWITGVAPGQVVRSAFNVVVIDLDGDGDEQTGWTVLHFHVANKDRVQEGAWVDTDDPLGHPSCEGGKTTGTHLHIARKYNGEWIPTDGPLPFVMGGWEAVAGEGVTEGQLTKKGKKRILEGGYIFTSQLPCNHRPAMAALRVGLGRMALDASASLGL